MKGNALKPYTCELCPMTFSRSSNLIMSYASSHRRKIVFMWAVSEEIFSKWSSERHIKIHTCWNHYSCMLIHTNTNLNVHIHKNLDMCILVCYFHASYVINGFFFFTFMVFYHLSTTIVRLQLNCNVWIELNETKYNEDDLCLISSCDIYLVQDHPSGRVFA